MEFVILVNTFEGLAGKTTMLAKFALMLIVLFPLNRLATASEDRREPAHVRRPGERRGRGRALYRTS